MSLYQQTVPVLTKWMTTLSTILDKGAKHFEENGKSGEDIINLRLYEDMKDFAFQIQACSNTAKNYFKTLGVKDAGVWEDNETTLEQLRQRCKATVEFLQSIDPKSMEGLESKELTWETDYGHFKFQTGQEYTSNYLLANFFFHVSIAYCILRNNGVPLGTLDFLRDVFVKTNGEKMG